jgi:uncharacterized protein (TIGR03437 family)
MTTQLISRVAALLLAIVATGPAWSQARGDAKKGVLPDVDLRAPMLAAETPQSSPSKTLVDRRTRSMEAFLAQRQATQPGIRIIPSRHGIPKLMLSDGKTLSSASNRDADEIARNFLIDNSAVFSFTQSEVDQLRLDVRDVTAGATYLVYSQTVNGIEVFQGQIKFTLSTTGEVIQAGSAEAVPGLNISTVPRLRPEQAEFAARTASRAETTGKLLRAPELVIFPLDASSARLAYRAYVEVDASQLYEVLIDAEDGKLLFRHNAYVYAAKGRVWTQSPSQGGSRQLVTFPDAWLPATATVTTGNNADVFLDTDGNDQPDPVTNAELQNGRPASASQVFDFAFGDGTVGLNPRNFKGASGTNLFYFVNIAHDFYYSLGFTEATGNFQTDNFGKGGVGGDAVIAEAQNAIFVNNAAFAPTPEGIAPRLRMGLFTRSTTSLTDDLDSDYDGQVVMHEYGHGVSNRLVGGRTSTSCLVQIQSGAMGEGWSDYFASSFFNNPVLGAYTSQNALHGDRRQSYEGYTFTYEDVGNSGYEVHDDGEIWAATLWDLRKSLRQTITDQLVVDGLKATPCNPSMTDARDAILTADLATNGGTNRLTIWTVFAKHGLGYSARGIDGHLQSGTVYDAAYDLPPDLQSTKNPVITSQPLSITAGAGQLYAYTVAASNPNAGTLNFALTSGPDGMTVSPSGSVTWIASFTAQRVKITVTDGQGGKVVHGYLAPVLTHLATDGPILISGATNSAGFAFVDVPSGVPVLQITLRDGVGDPDLFITDPDGNVALSARDGSNETQSFANPKSGRWQVEVGAFIAYSGVSLNAALITPALLSANTVVSGLGGVIGSETLYRVTVPPGAVSFKLATSGGTGDVDLYLKFGSPALCQVAFLVDSLCNVDASSETVGNDESITLVSPRAGDYYIDLSGFDSFAGVSLTTSLTGAPPQPDLTISKSHMGAFAPGQTGAIYTITVTNAGAAATIGPVSVTDSLPSGMTATAISGSGWNCLLVTLTCARADALAPSASYPPIAVTVTVAASAASSSLTNVATVSGGGDSNTANNTARDVTVIIPPLITSVTNAFGDNPVIASNTWIKVQGSNLAPAGDSRIWTGADFVNNKLPSQMDGVSVTVNGKSAYLYFISSTQINILTPPDALFGSVLVQVTNNGVTSNAVIVPAQTQSPSFFEAVSTSGVHYVYGTHAADGSLIGPTSLFLNSSTPVKPGEKIYLIANGFGPTDVPVVSGSLAQTGNLPAPFPAVTVGGIPATVSSASLMGIGTYMIQLTVPGNAPDGDLLLNATYNGSSTQPNLMITVRQ